jgi:hypothetical protein
VKTPAGTTVAAVTLALGSASVRSASQAGSACAWVANVAVSIVETSVAG